LVVLGVSLVLVVLLPLVLVVLLLVVDLKARLQRLC
jgi:hypothetical protein